MSTPARHMCCYLERVRVVLLFFFFNDTATTEIYTFPYTTLFRSLELVEGAAGVAQPAARHHRHGHAARRHERREHQRHLVADAAGRVLVDARCRPRVERERSEEHTSELQSRLHLVCRLLLEKKNSKTAL